MQPRPKRTFSREFKLQVVRQLVTGERSTAQVCREHDLCRTLVVRWREQYARDGEQAWLREQSTATVHVEADPQARIAALEAALGRAHLENEFLKKALELAAKKGSAWETSGR